MSIKAILLKHGRISGCPVAQDIHDRYSESSFSYYGEPGSLQQEGSHHNFSDARDESNPSELEVAFFDAAAAGNADAVQQLRDDRENINLVEPKRWFSPSSGSMKKSSKSSCTRELIHRAQMAHHQYEFHFIEPWRYSYGGIASVSIAQS